MRRTLLRSSLLLAGGVVLAAVLCLVGGRAASASPADPTVRTFTQPDGSTFAGHLFGDEHLNGVETTDGYTVVRDASGGWAYARRAPGGRLRPTTLRPSGDTAPPASAGLQRHLRDEVALAEAAAERQEAAEGAPASTPPAVGTQDVLVVLVEFTDRALTTTAADWADLWFGADQSVADYYDEASYGALDLQPATETEGTPGDGVVVVQLDRPHPDSGADFGSFRPVAAEALAAADPFVDFGAYDAAGDGDGRLSPDELHLGIVVAGNEAAQGCEAPSMWAHRASLFAPLASDDGGVLLGDGEARSGYFAGGELQCDLAVGQATLGIWVHEFGHDLGLLDLYDVDGSSAGVGTWSVMGLHWLALPGEAIGTNPPLPDPFSRWQVGWVTPTQATTADRFALTPAATTDAVLQVLDNPDGVDIGFLGGGGTGEYFLVENRRQVAYDVALAGCGALVWHIDESAFSNADDDARLVDVEEAGGRWLQSGFADADDPYPSTVPVNDDFGPSTSPSSALNTGLPSGVRLSGFSSGCPETLELDVAPGSAPVGRPANNHFADATLVRFSPFAATETRTLRGHNRLATRQAGEPRHAGGQGGASVWWRVVAPRNGHVTLTSSSTFQEVIGVYTGPAPGRLTRVRSIRGVPPDSAAGSAPGPESVHVGVGFRALRGVAYHVAVDSRRAGERGGVRLTLEYDQAVIDVRPVTPRVAPGQRPLLRVRLRNTSMHDRLRVYGLVEGSTMLHALDCPGAFVLRPGQVRTCVVRNPVTGPRGAPLRGKVSAWVQWLDAERFTTVADAWFARVRR